MLAAPGAALCSGCLDSSARTVRALLYHYVDLAQELLPGSRGDAPRVSGTTEAPVPLSLAADELLRSIHTALTGCADAVRAARGHPPVPSVGVRHGYAVQLAIREVAPRVAALSQLDGGVAALAELGRLEYAARLALGQVAKSIRMTGTCSVCDTPALHRVDGTDDVTCRHCGVVVTLDTYELLSSPFAGLAV